jgi:hypothetical protein
VTDLPDPAERIHAVNDSIRKKSRWLLEICNRTDVNARPTQEQLDEAKRVAQADDERTAA